MSRCWSHASLPFGMTVSVPSSFLILRTFLVRKLPTYFRASKEIPYLVSLEFTETIFSVLSWFLFPPSFSMERLNFPLQTQLFFFFFLRPYLALMRRTSRVIPHMALSFPLPLTPPDGHFSSRTVLLMDCSSWLQKAMRLSQPRLAFCDAWRTFEQDGDWFSL